MAIDTTPRTIEDHQIHVEVARAAYRDRPSLALAHRLNAATDRLVLAAAHRPDLTGIELADRTGLAAHDVRLSLGRLVEAGDLKVSGRTADGQQRFQLGWA